MSAGGRAPPPKPWEQAQAAGKNTTNTPAPAGAGPKPWENPQPQTAAQPVNGTGTDVTQGPPSRPWERASLAATTSQLAGPTYGTGYGANGGMYGGGVYGAGGYGTSGMYGNGGYGGSMYGSQMGSMYGAGSYGGGMYGAGGYGGGMYGAGAYGSRMYGNQMGGMYGSSMYGGGMGGMYGGGMNSMGMMGGMPGQDIQGAPPAGPSPRWMALLQTLQGVMHVFGRISFLVDENTQAIHFFITALLQLMDRGGFLYAELARFVFRLLGYKPEVRTTPKQIEGPGVHSERVSGVQQPTGHPAQGPDTTSQSHLRMQQANVGMPNGAWDNLWSSSGQQGGTVPGARRGMP